MDDIIDYSEECDYNALKNSIKHLLRKYAEFNDYGERNPEYDPFYTAYDLAYDVHELIGGI